MTETQVTDSESHADIKANESAAKDESTQEKKPETLKNKVLAFYKKNAFLIKIIFVILLAFIYPPLGLWLAPEITAGWIAVIFIFIMSGLSLKTTELYNASKRIEFNLAVQVFNLAILPVAVYGLTSALKVANLVDDTLADGMVITAALPMTVNMVIVLTKSAGGNEAAAVFNSALGNLLGVFVTPAWILLLLGQTTEISFVATVLKLVYRVIIPLMVGQVIQFNVITVKTFVTKHKPYFKKAQENCLVFIVYTVFCKTFRKESESSAGDIFLVLFLQGVLLVTAKFLAWYYMALLFRKEPRMRIMGWFGCTHKTVAMGIPLLNAIYGGDPRLGMYTLPLLVWHPSQLILGTIASPRLEKWARAMEEAADKEGSARRPADDEL